MSGRLTQAAYARHRKRLGLPGSTRQAVGKAVRDRRIELDDDGKLDPEVADRQWLERTNARLEGPEGEAFEGVGSVTAPSATRSSSPTSSPPTDAEAAELAAQSAAYRKSRAARERWNAETARLDYQRKAGDLVSKSVVRSAWSEVLRRLRERGQALPARCSSQILALVASGEVTEHAIRMVLEGEVAEVFRALEGRTPGVPAGSS